MPINHLLRPSRRRRKAPRPVRGLRGDNINRLLKKRKIIYVHNMLMHQASVWLANVRLVPFRRPARRIAEVASIAAARASRKRAGELLVAAGLSPAAHEVMS